MYTESLLYLDENTTVAVDKPTKAKAPDVKFCQESFKQFQAALPAFVANHRPADWRKCRHLRQGSPSLRCFGCPKAQARRIPESYYFRSLEPCGNELEFNLGNAAEKDARKELKVVWEVVLCNIHLNITPKDSRTPSIYRAMEFRIQQKRTTIQSELPSLAIIACESNIKHR